MTRSLLPSALAPLLLLLSACGTSSQPQAGATASGEVLPGTVNDAMLSSDRSQAEAPLAPAALGTANNENVTNGPAASEAAPGASLEAVSPPVAETTAATTPGSKPQTSALN